MGCEQAHGQERLSDQGVNDMGSASCMPTLYTMAMLTHRCTAMRTRHVVRKATFIKVNDNAAFALIAFNFLLEDAPIFFAGFGVAHALLQVTPRRLKHHGWALSADAKPFSALVLMRVRMILDILCQNSHVDLS
jgi:hypothetical protein